MQMHPLACPNSSYNTSLVVGRLGLKSYWNNAESGLFRFPGATDQMYLLTIRIDSVK